MSAAATIPVLDRLLDPLTRCLTPEVAERIANLRLDPQLQAELDELAAKANAGELTPEERTLYEEYVEAIDVVGILQAKARAVLAQHDA